ncbi:Ammonium transporter 1 member 1 (AtAMT1 [Durusdinium trenchii]|uniref:Ammonium transporter n=1 Tax=Durusdinium trenchii TaxID=1381693 RepID=A0ABP0P0I1_9DINO
MMKSGVIVVLSALAVANGSPEELQAEIQALRQQLRQQKVLIKEQGDRLLEEEEAQSRRLQFVDAATLSTQVAAWDTTTYNLGGAMDSLWLCLCGALVMFMHAGFAMLETGCCRAKNASNVLMKNLVNVCVGTLGWWLLGWAFAYGSQSGTELFGSSGFFGEGFYTRDASGNITPVSCGSDGCQSTMLSWFFQWAFCTAGATIVSGAVAERVKGPTYAAFAFVMTSFIYPMVVAWTWGGGWLAVFEGVGYMDFAGSGVVHLTGGAAGLAGTIVLGPRKGRFVNPEEFEPHNLPLVVLGTFALWFGWYGFNPGSTLTMKTGNDGALAAQVAMNTTLAAATGGITVFVLRYFITKKYDVGGLCNGILAGLVSITAGCGSMECGSAFATGLIGGFVYQGASMLLQKLKVDDPVDASPVHGFCGIWGCMAVALFDWGKGFDHYHGWSGWSCTPGSDGVSCKTGANGTGLGANVVMVLMIIVWAGLLSGISFFVLKRTRMLRISEEVEETGMDSHHHSPPKAYSLSAAPATAGAV